MPGRKIRCLYCNEIHEFLSGNHFKREDHFGPRDGAFERFKDWVASEHDLDRDHEVFRSPGALTRPETFEEYEHLFE